MALHRSAAPRSSTAPHSEPAPAPTARWITLAGALATAVLMVLAAPPLDLWPLAGVALIPLYLVLRDAPPLRAAGVAWLSALGFNLGGASWWVAMLERYFGLSLPAAGAIALGVCAYQALLFGLWALLCSLLRRRARVGWLFAAPLVLAVLESLLPFALKWYVGLTVWQVWPAIQAAELGGPAAVSALVALTNLTLAEAGLALYSRRLPGLAVRVGAAVVALALLAGTARGLAVAHARTAAPQLRVGVVQPNFGISTPEDRKLHGDQMIETLRNATRQATEQGAALTVWPESGWPYLFDRKLEREYPPGHPWELRPGSSGRLLVGALTHDFGGSTVYNSAMLLSETGEIKGRYDKAELLPFGEYVPFADRFPAWAERVRKRLPDFPEITAGASGRVLVDGDLRIAALICSEELDVGLVHSLARQGPNLLVSIINDAWFGTGGAPRQHMALAAFRAVEARRDLVRATNTGLSAVIDAVGRVRLQGAQTEGGAPADVLVSDVALLRYAAPGPYVVRFFPYGCLLLLMLGIVYARRTAPAAAGAGGRKKGGVRLERGGRR